MRFDEKYRVMTEEEKAEEHRKLEDLGEWEWSGRRPLVFDGDISPYKG